jgi:hypothetical protein
MTGSIVFWCACMLQKPPCCSYRVRLPSGVSVRKSESYVGLRDYFSNSIWEFQPLVGNQHRCVWTLRR